MSPVVTRSIPAPQQMPLTATTIGFAIVRNGGVASCGRLPLLERREVRLFVDGTWPSSGISLDVGAGAERPAGRR